MTQRPNTSELLPLSEYDKVIVAFSGGKDSLACVLHLIDLGVPKDRIELWHHCIDGAPGSRHFMDWPVTESYSRAVAEVLELPIRFSWKNGGFYGEMMREDALTQPTSWEATDGTIQSVGGTTGKKATRRLFPQVSANLSVRWCSAYLKIDVAKRVLCNDPAFKTGKFLLVTGERREESSARAGYAEIEKHGSTNKSRRVDQWRAVIDWTEAQVWDRIEEARIVPHPAYRLGWGRVSCRACIFGGADQWASVEQMAPETFEEIAGLEQEFGKTIHRSKSVREQAAKGSSYVPDDAELVETGNGTTYTADMVRTPQGASWELPAGAFKGSGCGPS